MSSSTPPQPEVRPAVSSDSPLRAGTPVGVDIGLRNLLAAAPASASADVSEGVVFDDDRIEEYYTTLEYVPDTTGHTATILADKLHRVLNDVAQDVVAYTASFDVPLLVLEDLSYDDRSLSDCIESGAAVECWLYPAMQRAIIEAAAEAGIPVVSVTEKHSTQQCHGCLDFARVGDETIQCTTEDCPVGTVCRDLSAAVTVAQRVR